MEKNNLEKSKMEKLFELLDRTSEDNEDLIKFIQKNQKIINESNNQKNKYGETPLIIAMKKKHNKNFIKIIINKKLIRKMKMEIHL